MAGDEQAKKEQEPVVESVPDPDEDDLDDLDELLDDFQAAKIDNPSQPTSTSKSSAATPEASGPGRPAQTKAKAPTLPANNDAPPGADNFAKQLQDSMAEMLQELESNPQMAKEFEEMMAQFGAPAPEVPKSASPSSTSKPTSASAAQPPAAAASFEDTIKRTMERMQASESSASAAAQNPSEQDFMAALLRDMQGGAGGEGGDDAFSKMLLGMMEQLTNKDILYDPMKELNTKFPGWMQERTSGELKGTVPEEDMQRYQQQAVIVKEIVDRFERPDYKDTNTNDREYIVERMQKMQAAGAPPPELVGDMSAAEGMLGELDSCPQQ